jgi:putative DNA primase/helicase
LYTVAVQDLPVIGPDVISSLAAALAPLTNKPERPKVVPVLLAPDRPVNQERYVAYARAALASAAQRLRGSTKGARSHQLFLAACGLGKWVHHGILDGREVTRELFEASRDCGLTTENGYGDVLTTIANGILRAKGDALPALKEKSGIFKKRA